VSDDDRPSHQYLYEMDREELFAMFVGAVNSLRVDESGVWCLEAEAYSVLRLARTVQSRVYDGIPADEIYGAELSPREDALRSVASTLRFLIPDYVVGMGNQRPPLPDAREPAGYGFEGTINHRHAGIVDEFYRERAALLDALPPTPASVSVPGDLSDDTVADVQLPLDDPAVQAAIAADPDLAGFIEQAQAQKDDSEG
jgi:hypothetical protein